MKQSFIFSFFFSFQIGIVLFLNFCDKIIWHNSY